MQSPTTVTRYSIGDRRRKKGMSGKNRFRALGRLVIENRHWLERLNLLSADLGDNVMANVRIIQSKATKGELRLGLEKLILRKHPEFRTEEEKEALYRKLGNLRCFRRYPEGVRKELVSHTYFVYYGANRTLIRQGHDSTFMAVLLAGELAIYSTYTDPVFGNTVTDRKANMVPGTFVGEVSLLHGMKRTATVETLTPVELLMLNKDDFDKVLKATLQAQWDEIKCALKKFHYFSLWGEDAIRECCITSDIRHYKEYDVILGLHNKRNMQAHFILTGECIIAQRIVLEKYGETWKLCENQNFKYPYIRSSYECMQTCVLKEGSCFGIGEDLTMRSVIANSDVTILRIPLYILEDHNQANVWNRVIRFQNSRIPTAKQVFEKFVEDRKWEAHTRSVLADTTVNRPHNHTTLHDVPLSIRSERVHNDEYYEYSYVVDRSKTMFSTRTHFDKNRFLSLGVYPGAT